MVHTIQRIIEDTAILTKIVRGTTRKDVHTIALTKFEQTFGAHADACLDVLDILWKSPASMRHCSAVPYSRRRACFDIPETSYYFARVAIFAIV